MKKYYRLIMVIFAISLTTLLSCKKEEKKTEEPIYESQLAAKIGNENYTASFRSGTINGEYILVTGFTAQSILSLWITGNAVAGSTITLVESGIESISWSVNNTSLYTSESGTINISKHDKTNKIIEGTFNATLHLFEDEDNKIQLTNGIFKIKYQNQ